MSGSGAAMGALELAIIIASGGIFTGMLIYWNACDKRGLAPATNYTGSSGGAPSVGGCAPPFSTGGRS